ncbi:MAG TPA: response regulator [Ktedonobacterales bacterium]|nr:response regulator [Ktedonobacterales bacterium]
MQPPSPHPTYALIVDDDQSIRETLATLLDNEGYAVLEARDGMEALALLRVFPHALVVVLDVWMPRLSGEGVLAAVEADSNLASRHAFVMVTARIAAGSPELQRLLAALAVPVIHKPFDVDELLSEVAVAARRLPLEGRGAKGRRRGRDAC